MIKGGYSPPLKEPTTYKNSDTIKTGFYTPLINLAFARSGDKGNHANIGVIAREPHFFPFIDKAINHKTISKLFKHVLVGPVLKWQVPGINGINFLLKNSLGGGGMASLHIDPQGKSYAQQLLEYSVPISKKIYDQIKD